MSTTHAYFLLYCLSQEKLIPDHLLNLFFKRAVPYVIIFAHSFLCSLGILRTLCLMLDVNHKILFVYIWPKESISYMDPIDKWGNHPWTDPKKGLRGKPHLQSYLLSIVTPSPRLSFFSVPFFPLNASFSQMHSFFLILFPLEFSSARYKYRTTYPQYIRKEGKRKARKGESQRAK